MKTPKIAKAMDYIDDDLISAAVCSRKEAKNRRWIRQLGIAAGAAAILLAVIAVFPFSDNKTDTLPVDTIPSENETAPSIGVYNPPVDEPDASNDEPTQSVEDPTSPIIVTTTPAVGSTVEIEVPVAPAESTALPTTGSTRPTTIETVISEEYCYSVTDAAFSSYVRGKVIAEEKVGNKIADVSVMAGWKSGSGEWITNEKLRAELYSIKGVSNDVAVALKFIDKGDALTTTHYYVIMNPDADLTIVKDYIIGADAPSPAGNDAAENGLVTGYTTPFPME